MKHFLEISQLSVTDVMQLLQRAEELRHLSTYPTFPGRSLVNLFYEPSTRTRVSFELAAAHLALKVINLDTSCSSESKGEQLLDTVRTLAAMRVNVLVMRHAQDGLVSLIAAQAPAGIQIINAGDGQHAHPTQALLDWMTILQHKPQQTRLKIVIVGDVRHSRVAHSFQALASLLQMHELVLVAPRAWLPDHAHYARMTTCLRDGLTDADVVMALRVQRERLAAHDELDLDAYCADYTITAKRWALAKPDAILMHPGPLNRGIEVDDATADGSSAVIWQQVGNGVFMRMAIIERLLAESSYD